MVIDDLFSSKTNSLPLTLMTSRDVANEKNDDRLFIFTTWTRRKWQELGPGPHRDGGRLEVGGLGVGG